MVNKVQSTFICEVCGQEINSLPNLKRHIAAKHSSREHREHLERNEVHGIKPCGRCCADSRYCIVDTYDAILPRTPHRSIVTSLHLRGLQFTVVGRFFLPSLMKARFGGMFDNVVSGFPILRRKSENATCIDFLLFQTVPSREWWLIEVVFRKEEIRPKRLDRYRRACLEGMPARVADLRKLKEESTSDQRRAFRNLIRSIKSYDIDAPIHFVAILPCPIALKATSGIEILLWNDLLKLKLDIPDVLWGKLSDLILTQIPTPVRGGTRDMFYPDSPEYDQFDSKR